MLLKFRIFIIFLKDILYIKINFKSLNLSRIMINLMLIFASRLVWRKFDFLPVDILVVFFKP